jgi:signal transduction histidine kinase
VLPVLPYPILTYATLGLAVTDESSVIQAVSPGLCRLLSVAEADLVGRCLPELFGPASARAASLLEEVSRSDEASETRDIEYIHPILGPIHLLCCAWPLHDATYAAARMIVHLTDVREPLPTGPPLESGTRAVAPHMQLMLPKSREGSDLAELISQDPGAPLSTILEYADLLESELRGEGPPHSHEWLERISEAARRISGMIQDLHDSGRLEAGGVVLDRQPTDVQALAERIATRLTSAERAQRVRVICDAKPPSLNLDVERFDRALSNLIVNGLKFSGANAEVTVAIRSDEHDVWLAVTDRGRGIPTVDIPRIFEPYYRVKTDTRAEGVGLGLYIARLIIEEHGGHVDVTSVPGIGSSFMITMPLKSADTPA